jgi:hypothetical protein
MGDASGAALLQSDEHRAAAFLIPKREIGAADARWLQWRARDAKVIELKHH